VKENRKTGMMEKWNDGLTLSIFLFLPNIPLFQYSIIPLDFNLL